MKSIMMIMKKAGNNAVIVRMPESGSPYKCMKIAAIMKNFGIDDCQDPEGYPIF